MAGGVLLDVVGPTFNRLSEAELSTFERVVHVGLLDRKANIAPRHLLVESKHILILGPLVVFAK